MCVPDTNPCDLVDCAQGFTCIETCTGMSPMLGGCGDGTTPPGSCTAQCVATPGNPGTCNGPVTCQIATPACPTGTSPGAINGCWSGYCIPDGECGMPDPGTCDPITTCAIPPPNCPTNTVAGTRNGCYSGYCIPQGECSLPCESETTETSCEGRSDCIPVYQGDNCTCYPGYCTCESETFERCESGMTPQPLPV
jgi:hypothetical protein